MLKRSVLIVFGAAASFGAPLMLGTAQAAPEPVAVAVRLNNLCADMGLAPGTLDFTYCVKSLAMSAGLHPSYSEGEYNALPGFRDRSYVVGSFYGSNQRLRMQRACAGLGLPVGSRSFGQCVVNLQASLTTRPNQNID